MCDKCRIVMRVGCVLWRGVYVERVCFVEMGVCGKVVFVVCFGKFLRFFMILQIREKQSWG